jgi:signal transduction histidine kinase
MIRRALAGLRGRLLLALVFTSAVTLAVAAAIMLSPLQSRLRNESATSLRQATFNERPDLEKALRETASQNKDEKAQAKTGPEGVEAAEAARRGRRYDELGKVAQDLRDRTGGARVLVADLSFTDTGDPPNTPSFLYDTDFVGDQTAELALAFRALRENGSITEFLDDDLLNATPLYDAAGKIAGVAVAERNVTEVTTSVRLVRNALFAAAGIGLAVAVGLGLALSSTLTRRLGRLQRSALRITAEGPDAPTPTDRGADEVADLARAIGRMQEELRRQEAARRSFVATASHELRTPLTMLQGTMELLEEDLRDGTHLEDAQEQVQNARRELRRLAVLASELLDLSRLDADVQLRSEPVELTEITRAVVAEFGLRAAEKDVPLEVFESREPCWAKADPAACARVVRILIDNALRYAPAGRPIRVSAERAQRTAIVRVSDEGPGVAVEEREHIFERFHRGKASSVESGFGLGLAIGRELAERMGGTLALEDCDIGACFVLRLPASASSPAPSPAPDSAAAA